MLGKTLIISGIVVLTIIIILSLSSCSAIVKDKAQIESIIHDVSDEVLDDAIEVAAPIKKEPLPEFQLKPETLPISYPLEIGTQEIKTVS